MASLDSLTDGEIRTKLHQLGCPVGPVTATTRKVLLKKLKILEEQRGASSGVNFEYDPRCSITQFSSGEESDDASSKNRRKSMPPPRTTKSPRKKSPGRNPLANSTLVDHTVKNSVEEITNNSPTTTVIEGRRSTRHSVATQDLPSYRNQLKSNDFVLDNTDPDDIHWRPSLVIRSPETTSRYSTGTSFPTAEPFRFRTQHNTNNLTPQSTPISYNSNQPYSSEFARRLTSLSSSRAPVSTPPVSLKLLDVKESDDEDNGSVPVYAKFSQSNVKGIHNLQTKANGKGVFSQENWFSFDSPVSAVLVVILLLFFITIGAVYVNMHSLETGITGNTDLKYPLCSLHHMRALPGENCIRDDDVQAVTLLFQTVQIELYDRASNAGCLDEPEHISNHAIVNLLREKDKVMSHWQVENHLGNLKVLINNNPDWKIIATNNEIYLSELPITLFCYIYKRFIVAASWLFKFSVLVASIYACYRGLKWWMWRQARHNDEVYKLVSSILEIVSAKAQESNSFVPIGHVRDQLIPHKDRRRMTNLWNEAVKILESDSRLRCEVQQVEGEEFDVWRWLASPLNSKRKVWQGQAFETVEGSVNSLPESPTSYLKIRHMFDPTLEEGEDWVVTVADAILEKCGDAKILHIVVDKQSREGCVYMKCLSQRDAGIAYRALHGSWFDSKLVTVKYIREKRYLERFPESVRCNEPLRPSNDMKNSLQN